MKCNMKILCCTAVSGLIFLSGCKDNIKEPTPVKNDFSISVADSEQKEKINGIINSYLSSLEHHSLSELAECTAVDFSLCNDETAFYDMTTGLSSARLDGIDFDNLQIKKDEMMVTVDYTLIYSGSFTNDEGSIYPPGEYSTKELFLINTSNDEYKISGTEKTAAG